MMEIITCKQCGGEINMLNKTAVIVKYKSYKRCCDHCNSTREESYSYYFCCENCFETYYIHDTQRVEPKIKL